MHDCGQQKKAENAAEHEKHFQLLLSPPPSSPIWKTVAPSQSGKSASASSNQSLNLICPSNSQFKGKRLQEEFENLENCAPKIANAPSTAFDLKTKPKTNVSAGAKKITLKTKPKADSSTTTTSAKKKCKRKKKQNIQYWELSTLSSESFDLKRLTERQQLAILTKKSQIEASGRSENLEGATGNLLLKSISPFVLDKLDNDQEAFGSSKSRTKSTTSKSEKPKPKTQKNSKKCAIPCVVEEHSAPDAPSECVNSLDIVAPASIEIEDAACATPDTISCAAPKSIDAIEGTPVASPSISKLPIDLLFAKDLNYANIVEQYAQLIECIEMLSFSKIGRQSLKQFLVDGHRSLGRHASYLEEARLRSHISSSDIEISKLKSSFCSELSYLLTFSDVL